MTSFLVTGGTGSFGNAFIRRLLGLKEQVDITRLGGHQPRYVDSGEPLADRVVVFSRDELKQHEMRQQGFTDERLRWFIGDVRDRDRLTRAFQGVDVVIHAAALKQVDTCEFNPLEAKRTNIDGAANVIDAALDVGVRKVLALGTDKAVDPTNLYGATKLVQEKLIVDANAYSGKGGPVFSCTRYGNVISSRGSVLPVFERQHREGRPLTLTAEGMTRFVMTLPQCVDFVLQAIREMAGGEVFVPKLPAATLETIAAAATFPCEPTIEYVGLRPGEKRHEAMVSVHESPRTRDRGWAFQIDPLTFQEPLFGDHTRVPDGFTFTSDQTRLLSVGEFRRLAGLEERRAA